MPETEIENKYIENLDEADIVKPVTEFLDYTTAHGLGRLKAAKGARKTIWCVFILTTYIGFSVHLSTLVTRYLAKPLLTTYDSMFPYEYPDIYICPSNAISLSRIVKPLTNGEIDFLQKKLKFDRKQFNRLFTKADLGYTMEKSAVTLLDFNIWGGNITWSEVFSNISTSLNKIEQLLMKKLLITAKNNSQINETQMCSSLVDRGESYTSKVSHTVDGYECQNWAESYPHKIPDKYAIYNHSYCRNPLKEGRAPYCYTKNPAVRWQYCSVPICKDSINSNYCYNSTDFGKYSYTGFQNTTYSGLTCQAWSSQSPHSHSHRQLANQSNYCRNPDMEKDGPWCYTTSSSKRWESCAILACPTQNDECYRKEDTGQFSYKGTRSTTVSGLTCQHWQVHTPHDHTFFPVAVLENNNYCRNPIGDEISLWCYTTNRRKRWEPCSVPKCTDDNVKIIMTTIHDHIKDILLHKFGNDLYFNLVDCNIGDQKCTAEDFTTLSHPSLGVCHKLNSYKFVHNKTFMEKSILNLDLQLYADATDVRGQKYEHPTILSLDMSMKPKVGTTTTNEHGFHILLLPKGEFPHNVISAKELMITAPSGRHTTIQLRLNQDEQFPDGQCIEEGQVQDISYIMTTWKSFNSNKNTTHMQEQNNTLLNGTLEDWQAELFDIMNVFTDNDVHATTINFKQTRYDCINYRIINSFLTNCNCVPSFLPIPKNMSNPVKYPFCFYGNFDVMQRSQCYDKVMQTLPKLIQDGLKECPERCNIPSYLITRTSVPWPNNNLQTIRDVLKNISYQYGYPLNFNKWRGLSGIFYAYLNSQFLLYEMEDKISEKSHTYNFVKLNRIYQGLSSNLAKVTIEGRAPYGDRTVREEAYPIKNLMADFGGLLGLWSGISVLTMCELIELICFVVSAIRKLYRKRQTESKRQTNQKVNLESTHF